MEHKWCYYLLRCTTSKRPLHYPRDRKERAQIPIHKYNQLNSYSLKILIQQVKRKLDIWSIQSLINSLKSVSCP